MIQTVSRLAGRLRHGSPASIVTRPEAFLALIHEQRNRLDAIADLRTEVDALDSEQSRGDTAHLDNLTWVARAFATVDAAAHRGLGLRFHDVQFLGGLALVHRSIAEMQTGEGKTLTTALPAFIFTLAEHNVHVMTANAYLAERDAESMRPLFEQLGLRVGLLDRQAPPSAKRAAYDCDITYGPGYEFAFDYLRDEIQKRDRPPIELGDRFLAAIRGQALPQTALLQHGLAYAIVDEVDHVLIDDASSPLVISDADQREAEDAEIWRLAHHLVRRLESPREYTTDAALGRVVLTAAGRDVVGRLLDRIPVNRLLRPWMQYVEQSIRAAEFFQRDVHYVVRDEQLMLVDQSTGRIFADRHWQDGLHQAVQAREGLLITRENRSLGRITRQRFFTRYRNLCGMTGTAVESAPEFFEFYRLPVVAIPPWKPCRRTLAASRVFADSARRWEAIANDVQSRHEVGQPTLIGTRTIEASETLADFLERRGMPFRVLNGLQNEDEAEIIAAAGMTGAITVATNMAGRGTDIRLGPGVAELGGLHVIGSEHHHSRRVDRQLLGRAARQGDPGSAAFFASAEDELIAVHEPHLAQLIRQSANANGEVTRDLSGPIRRIQKRVEREAWRGRRALAMQDHEHSNWLQQLLTKSA